MKIEKSAPDGDGRDIIQYRCPRCARIELVRLFRRSRNGLIEGDRGPRSSSKLKRPKALAASAPHAEGHVGWIVGFKPRPIKFI